MTDVVGLGENEAQNEPAHPHSNDSPLLEPPLFSLSTHSLISGVLGSYFTQLIIFDPYHLQSLLLLLNEWYPPHLSGVLLSEPSH